MKPDQCTGNPGRRGRLSEQQHHSRRRERLGGKHPEGENSARQSRPAGKVDQLPVEEKIRRRRAQHERQRERRPTQQPQRRNSADPRKQKRNRRKQRTSEPVISVERNGKNQKSQYQTNLRQRCNPPEHPALRGTAQNREKAGNRPGHFIALRRIVFRQTRYAQNPRIPAQSSTPAIPATAVPRGASLPGNA